ncbi:hypothetical protein YC2023_057593 [Brassica napus]
MHSANHSNLPNLPPASRRCNPIRGSRGDETDILHRPMGASLCVSYALAMAVISPQPLVFLTACFALYLLFPLRTEDSENVKDATLKTSAHVPCSNVPITPYKLFVVVAPAARGGSVMFDLLSFCRCDLHAFCMEPFLTNIVLIRKSVELTK